MRAGRARRAALAVLATCAALPAASAATTVEGFEGGVVVTGTSGDDTITVSTPSPPPDLAIHQEVQVEDAAGVTASGTCVQTTATLATCPQIVMTEVAGGDGNDTITAAPDLGWVEVYGQGGDDVLAGAWGLDGGDGADELIGGDGTGSLRGGPGPDLLRAGPQGNSLRGGPGDDTLTGGPGPDALDGEEGDDVLRGEAPTATTAAQSGADTLDGGDGIDVATYAGRTDPLRLSLGGDQAEDDGADGEQDSLWAIETLVSGSGDDVLLVRDGVAETVGCGEGVDRAELDPLDVLATLPAPGGGCEQANVAAYVPPPPPPPPPPPAGSDQPPVSGPPAKPVMSWSMAVRARKMGEHGRARFIAGLTATPAAWVHVEAVAHLKWGDVVVSSGAATVASAGDTTVKLVSTREGRKLLRVRRSIAVQLKVTLVAGNRAPRADIDGGRMRLWW